MLLGPTLRDLLARSQLDVQAFARALGVSPVSMDRLLNSEAEVSQLRVNALRDALGIESRPVEDSV